MRPRAVRAAPDELDLEVVRGGGQRTRLCHHLPHRKAAIDVRAEDRLHLVERAGVEDGERPLADLLGGLQDNEHVAVGGRLGEQRRCADRPRSVHVVSAGVHHARRARRERQSGGLVDGECVDVTADGDKRTAAGATGDSCNEPRAPNPVHVGDAEVAQLTLQHRRGALLAERQLRMAMQIAPERNEPSLEGLGNRSCAPWGRRTRGHETGTTTRPERSTSVRTVRDSMKSRSISTPITCAT